MSEVVWKTGQRTEQAQAGGHWDILRAPPVSPHCGPHLCPRVPLVLTGPPLCPFLNSHSGPPVRQFLSSHPPRSRLSVHLLYSAQVRARSAARHSSLFAPASLWPFRTGYRPMPKIRSLQSFDIPLLLPTMSREFQLRLIRSSLDELGYSHLAQQLHDETSHADSLSFAHQPSSADDLFAQVLKHNIEVSNYPTIIDVLDKLAAGVRDGTSSELGRGLVQYLRVDAANDVEGAIWILKYLVHRFILLQQVLARVFTPNDDGPALIDYYRHHLDPALDAIDAYLQAPDSLPSPVFPPELLAKLSKLHETDVFVPLLVQSHVDFQDLDPLVFTSDCLLVPDLAKVPLERDIVRQDLKTIYFSRLKQVLVYQLLGPTRRAPSTASSGPLVGPDDLPHGYLADIIDRSRLYSKHQLLYYLPHRFLDPLSQNEQEIFEEPLLTKDLESIYQGKFPIKPLHQLSEHTDEAWFTKFSPLGQYLVTGSLDGTLVIYDVYNQFKTLAILDSNYNDHSLVFLSTSYKPSSDKKKGVIYCCWDPHEKYLVACCLDTVIRIWSIGDLTLKNRRITRSMEDTKLYKLTCCFTLGENVRAWSCEFLPSRPGTKPHFIIGSPDIKLKAFTIDGEELFDFYAASDENMLVFIDQTTDSAREPAGIMRDRRSSSVISSTNPLGTSTDGSGDDKKSKQFNRINDLAITPDGKILITANNDKQVRFYTIPDLFDPTSTTKRLATINLNGRLTSCSVSHSGNYLLVSIAPDELQVWDISKLQYVSNGTNDASTSTNYFNSSHASEVRPPILKLRLFGHTQDTYIVRSCFGYVNTATGEEELVLTGSDTGYVYFWKLETGQLITRVKAHTGLCNSVDWNRNFGSPRRLNNGSSNENGIDFGTYWCSVGDDRLVRIWGNDSNIDDLKLKK